MTERRAFLFGKYCFKIIKIIVTQCVLSMQVLEIQTGSKQRTNARSPLLAVRNCWSVLYEHTPGSPCSYKLEHSQDLLNWPHTRRDHWDQGEGHSGQGCEAPQSSLWAGEHWGTPACPCTGPQALTTPSAGRYREQTSGDRTKPQANSFCGGGGGVRKQGE